VESPIDAWTALLRVHAVLAPILDRELRRAHGLPLSWFDVLTELDAAPGRRLTMTALGEAATASRSRVSRLVDELAGAGLVRKEANPADARSAYAVLTADGRRRLRQAVPGYRATVAREFGGRLSAREVDVVARALAKVLAADR
jgi:DNA-binding MarR family transcriptional regulator